MIKRSDALIAVLISLTFHGVVFALTALDLPSSSDPIDVKPLEISVLEIEEQAEEFEAPRPQKAETEEEQQTLVEETETLPEEEPVEVPVEEEPPVVEKKPKKELQKKNVLRKNPPKAERRQQVARASLKKGAPRTSKAVGESPTALKVRGDYRQLVATMLAKAKRYPRMARGRGQEGEGILEIWISSNGRLKSIAIKESSSHRLLDREMRQMAKRAAPFPAFPENMELREIQLVVPIRFELR